LIVEVQAGEKSNGSSDQEQAHRDGSHVTEVQQVGNKHITLQSGEIHNRVQEDVQSS